MNNNNELEQKIKHITSLAEALGWVSVVSKNPHMISFIREESGTRCNIYFTTMTVTFQWLDRTIKTFKNVDHIKDSELEHLLSTYE